MCFFMCVYLMCTSVYGYECMCVPLLNMHTFV